MSKLRFMSQNQWNVITNFPEWEEQGLDASAKNRMKGHVRVFQELMPDIIGGQEVNMEMQKYLKFCCMDAGLPYTQIYGHYTPIIYRADKLILLDTEYILYPEYVEGYDGIFNDDASKACNLGVFQDKQSGDIFIFATTHLWWKNGNDPAHKWYQAGSDQVRTMQIKLAKQLIEKYQEKYNNCPAILAGDLNAVYHSEAIQYAITEGNFQHAHDVAVEYAHEGEGYNLIDLHGPGKVWEKGTFYQAIDHILIKDMPQGSVRRFDRYTPDYYLALSDHAPVFVDIEFH